MKSRVTSGRVKNRISAGRLFAELGNLLKYRRSDTFHLSQQAERAMSTPKAEAATMLDALPKDSSFEDIPYHLQKAQSRTKL